MDVSHFGAISHDWVLPPMVSYSQNFEDVLLRRALQDIQRGFYVDLGASDPMEDSCTAWFYGQGWRGVNVEPHPQTFRTLAAARPEDVNLNVAVGAAPGVRPLHLFGPTVGSSTLHEDRIAATEGFGAALTDIVQVDVVTLEGLLASHAGGRTIDFLKIDVEGSEAEILSSTNFDRFRPRLLVVEAQKVSSEPPWRIEADWEGWEPHLLRCGYRFVWYDGGNRWYLREEDAWRRRWFGVPPCSLDHFQLAARGRFIDPAVEGERRRLDELRAALDAERARLDAVRRSLDARSG